MSGPGRAPVKRLPVLRRLSSWLPVRRLARLPAAAAAGGDTITGIEKMRDDVAVSTDGLDAGRDHEHALLRAGSSTS